MRRALLVRFVAGFVATLGVSCATVRPAGLAPSNAPQPKTLAEAWERADRDAASAVAAHRWPDLALGVVHQGKLIFFRGYGARDQAGHPVTEDSVFRFGSLTKSFTDNLLLQLRDEGRLSIDAPLERYLPEIRGVVYPTAEHTPITLRQLMSHSSGLPRLGRFDYTTHAPSEQEALDSLKGLPLDATPGTSFEYSNFALCLAGVVVQRVTGVPYHDAVRARIFEPLGMRAGWAPEDFPERLADGHAVPGPPVPDWRLGVCDSAGGIYGSLDDLARWAMLQLSAWPPSGAPESKVASRATLREAQSGASPFLQPRSVQGMGWVPTEAPPLDHVVWHNGSTLGYSAELWMMPESDLAVVALAGLPFDHAFEQLVVKTLATVLPFFPRPALELSSYLHDKVTALLRSIEPGTAVPADLYSKGYLAATKSPPELTNDTPETEIAFMRRVTGGSCAVASVRESRPFYAAFRIRCAGGELDMTLNLSQASPYSIEGSTISPAK